LIVDIYNKPIVTSWKGILMGWLRMPKARMLNSHSECRIQVN